jgi:4-amino-4-deoxy-L-arabinose transferase-like glycosyltransferase
VRRAVEAMHDAGRRFAYLVCIPLCITLVFQMVLMASVHVVEYDEAIFLDVARNIQRSGLPLRSIGEAGVYFFDHTPLYLYLLSAVGSLCGNEVFLLRLVTLMFALGCVILVFVVGQSLRGTIAGIVSASLLALNPFFST